MQENQFDAIIIGSGIGGLTVGALLSKLFQKRVLVLEQHFKLGGFTHTFKRNHWEWDVGIHYIGEMEKGTPVHNIIHFLTEGNLNWYKMDEPFEEFIYPDIRFLVYGNPEKFCNDLIELFPKEKESIVSYFEDIEKTTKKFLRYISSEIFFKSIKEMVSWLGLFNIQLLTTKEYLDHKFKDNILKSILASRWGDYGLPPSKSSFLIHSLIEKHYQNGGWYPIGGSSKIASSILPSIQKNGGLALVNHKVDKILIQNNKAIGVEVSHLKGNQSVEKKIFYSKLIISNAGLYNTYNLVEDSYLNSNIKNLLTIAKQEILDTYKDSLSTVTLYLGLKEEPGKIGIEPRNYWIYKNYDHDTIETSLEVFPKGIYVSFPSSKNPEAKAPTAEIISFIDYNIFEKWKYQAWKKRDKDYEDLKAKISDQLLNFVSQYIPSLSKDVIFKELSTPITNEHFTLHPKGSIYGIPYTNHRLRKKWITPNTLIENLFVTGADSFTPGFVGAMMGGFFCTSRIMGFTNVLPLMKLLKL